MLRRKLASRQQAASKPVSTAQSQPSRDRAGTKDAIVIDLTPLSPVSWLFPRIYLNLTIFALLHVAGLFLFASGFLLTRLELDNRSTCASAVITSLSKPPAANYGNGTCWHPKRYDRAILIIIDALRHDFILYNETLASDPSAQIPSYLNKLPVFHRILKEQPGHGLSFRVRADPPTTTLQRLKAITTGTLPTFVDAGSNFFGQVVGEDNLLDQLLRNQKRITFMGDDTWTTMFPHSLNESHPYPSFDVWDLHTVDNGVLQHLYPTMESREWDFLIAHFLGVDHAGHRYGPDHPAMGEKLTQMNDVLETVFRTAPSDAVVFVMGDHGMDPKGDHGGDSENEVNAGMFVYSKTSLVDVSSAATAVLSDVLADSQSLDVGSDEPFVAMEDIRTLPQIDFVPTLAFLLGIPVPFGNLGTIIPELFLVRGDGGNKVEGGFKNLLQVARMNAIQIHTYLRKYSEQRMAASLAVGDLQSLFDEAESLHGKLGGTSDVKVLRDVYLKYLKYTRRALVTARQVWARFDVPLIIMGSIVLLTAIVTLALYVLLYLTVGLDPPYLPPVVGAIIGVIVASSGIIKRYAANFEGADQAALRSFHEIIFGGVMGLCLPFISIGTYKALRTTQTTSILSNAVRSPNVWLGTLTLAFHYLKPASDSFTIHEDSITVYIIQAFGLFNLLRSFRVTDPHIRDRLVQFSLLFMILTRTSQISTICREEQHPYCVPTFNASPTTSVAAPETIFVLWLMIPVVILANRAALRSSDSMEGAGWVVPNFFVPSALVISAGYWTLDAIDNSNSGSVAWAGDVKVYWARYGFLLGALSCGFLWASDPVCLGLEVVETQAPDGQPGRTTKRLCVNGMANAMGASWFVFLTSVYVVLVMYQKPMGGVMLGVAYLQVICLCEMAHLWRDRAELRRTVVEKKAGKKVVLPPGLVARIAGKEGEGPLREMERENARVAAEREREKKEKEKEPVKGVGEVGLTYSFLAIMALLAHRYYFATGHQATLSTIQWDVGLTGLLKMHWTASPLMVALNTFASHIFFALAAPLLVLWKRPLLSNTEKRFETEIIWCLISYLTIVGCGGSIAAVFAGHFRRHLMVWRVFAPRFLFGAAEVLVVDGVVLGFSVVALGICRKGYSDWILKWGKRRMDAERERDI
ncbi:mannose-ethanolamine phosphotransferase gpi13 [Rhizophlyctis rosea]|nr:mannose-ethanolamine phosphotransferase gpi13 [Rhizophlyctis rosea]